MAPGHRLKKSDMDDLFKICRFSKTSRFCPKGSRTPLREPCNRKNEWKFKFTFYGFCLEFNNDTDSDILKKISVGRQTSLRNDTSLFKYSYGYFSGHIIWSI